jgi:hypothetical protein
MSTKLSEKHANLIRAFSEYMETLKFPKKSKVLTYRVVILKCRKKGEYMYIGEEMLEGHHEFPYISIQERKNLIIKEKENENGKLDR